MTDQHHVDDGDQHHVADPFAELAEAQAIARATSCSVCLARGRRVVRTNAGELVVSVEHGERCPNDRRARRPRGRRRQ
jgi:hypothetical protein